MTKRSNLNWIDRLQFPWLTASMDSSKMNSAKWQQISDSLLSNFENGLEDYIVGPADTVLCSEEGVKLKVHKVKNFAMLNVLTFNLHKFSLVSS